jgi:heat shock protein HslJ
MTRWIVVALLVCVSWTVAAQTAPPQIFPIGQSYRAMFISGYDVSTKGLAMVISRTAGEYRASGNAGCNTWNSMVVLRDTEIDFVDIATTKKVCGKPEMAAADAFLTSLRQAKRWRLDRVDLIITGDNAELRFKPGLAKFKAEKAPATKKKPH